MATIKPPPALPPATVLDELRPEVRTYMIALDRWMRESVLGMNTIQAGGPVGGVASAGSGNQYVPIIVNGKEYKVLHDGIIT